MLNKVPSSPVAFPSYMTGMYLRNKPPMPTLPRLKIKPKICLVYDRVTTKHGGAEYLLQQLLSLFSEAPLFTALYDQTQTPWVQPKRVRASILNRWRIIKKWSEICTPLLPLAFEALDVSGYDIVISISSAEAKGVLTKPSQIHLNYLFSPPKYLEQKSSAYLRTYKVLKLPGMLTLAQAPLKYLRWWDQAAAARPDYIIPITTTMCKQLRGSYTKNLLPSIYPPIAIPSLPALKNTAIPTTQPYFLSLSRLVWYKRIDLVIAAALERQVILLVGGEGVMKHQLIKQANQAAGVRRNHETIAHCIEAARTQGKTIVFLGAVSDQEKTSLLIHAQATVQLGKEDFGLVAIESLAHGTPAIVFSQSGAAEIIRDQYDGFVLSEQSIPALSRAFTNIQTHIFSRSSLRKRAQIVAAQQFKKAMKTIVYDVWKSHIAGEKYNAS